MRTTMAVEDVRMSLPELIGTLAPGDEVILTRNRQPVAKLLGEPPVMRKPRTPGNCKGMIALLIENDEHLEGFAEDFS